MPVRVRVPATSANLGPGFDALGLALDLYNVIEMELTGDGLVLETTGTGAGEIPRDESNLIVRAAQKVFRAVGLPKPGLTIRVTNEIPPARGLGSSAAAIIGGLVAANELVGAPFGTDELLAMALEEEGHADNITAALLGGVTVAGVVGRNVRYLPVPLPVAPLVVVVIPDYPLPTWEARAVLPKEVPFADAIFNVGRAALLVTALATGRWEALSLATEDRLHQPFRRHLLPGMTEAFQAAARAGAAGMALSGSGPTVLAFAPEAPQRVLAAMQKAYAEQGIATTGRVCQISPRGAQIITEIEEKPGVVGEGAPRGGAAE